MNSTSAPLFITRAASAFALAVGCILTLPASAQVPEALGGVRTFPDAALRGTLIVTSASEALLNGRALRMAPGMRLFSPQNTLVMAHTVLGQAFRVNYLIEPSTGMLQSAWILTLAEEAQPRKGSDAVHRNYRTEFDSVRH